MIRKTRMLTCEQPSKVLSRYLDVRADLDGSKMMILDARRIAAQEKTTHRDLCPICAGESRRLFERNRVWIRDCVQCEHRFADVDNPEGHVQRIYGAGYFTGDGAGYPDYLGERELRISQGKRYARLLNRYMQPGTIFDVGAAAGFVLKGFEEEGWRGAGVEPNSEMAEYARRQMHVAVETGTLEELMPNERFDVVSLIQVIAHFVDPRRALGVARSLTNPGGYWLIETWNKDSWTARIFGSSWHEYSPPSVLHWFSPATLRELVAQFGLEEIARGRTTKWIRPAHAKSIGQNELNRTPAGRLISATARLLPDRMSLPYLAGDLFWALFKNEEAKASGRLTSPN